MKQIINKLAILFLGLVSCCACSDDDEEQNARLSVVDFYPSIVMEGINLTVVGTDVESVKAVSEVLSPVSGVIINVNDELDTAPEKINEDPYGAWIIEVEVSEVSDELMTEEEYKEFIKE